jgi:hypothetical protein
MRLLVSVLVLGLTACGTSLQSGGSVQGVRLAATPTAARDSIVLTLTNGSALDVGYNLCTTAIERLTGDTWQSLPTDRVCTMELRTLQPGGQDRFTTTLPAGAAPGDYRFATGVNIPLEGERSTVTSNVVRVGS